MLPNGSMCILKPLTDRDGGSMRQKLLNNFMPVTEKYICAMRQCFLFDRCRRADVYFSQTEKFTTSFSSASCYRTADVAQNTHLPADFRGWSCMLPKKNRLTTQEIEEVFSRGKSMRTSCFLMRTFQSPTPRDSVSSVKYAVAISKKMEPTSVGRHKLKRAFYNALLGESKKSNFNYTAFDGGKKEKNTIHIVISPLFSHAAILQKNGYADAVTRLKDLLAG